MMRLRRHRSDWFANLALALAGVWVGVLLFESLLRIAKPVAVSTQHYPCIYQVNPELGYGYAPGAVGRLYRDFEIDNRVEINSSGFHDVDHGPKSEGEMRIVVVGDSFTAALEVQTAETWTQMMQQTLRERGYAGLEVVNLGLDGTGSAAHLAILKRHLARLQPDWVILAFFRNDLADMAGSRLYRACYRDYVLFFQQAAQHDQLRALVDRHERRYLSRWLFEQSYLFRAVAYWRYGPANLWRNNYIGPYHLGQTVERVTPPEAETIFQEFVELSEQYDFEFALLPVPSKEDGCDSLRVLRRHVFPTTLSRLTILDVSALLQERLAAEGRSYQDMFWVHDGHLNVAGNRILGAAAAEAIITYLNGQIIEGRC